MNNEIPKALVFNALIPTWVYFLSIPVVGNPVLSSDAKISYRVNPLEILVICLVLYEQRDYESTSPRNSYSELGSTWLAPSYLTPLKTKIEIAKDLSACVGGGRGGCVLLADGL